MWWLHSLITSKTSSCNTLCTKTPIGEHILYVYICDRPNHTADLQAKNNDVLEQPDLPPTQMSGIDLRWAVSMSHPSNISEFKLFCLEKWAKISYFKGSAPTSPFYLATPWVLKFPGRWPEIGHPDCPYVPRFYKSLDVYLNVCDEKLWTWIKW